MWNQTLSYIQKFLHFKQVKLNTKILSKDVCCKDTKVNMQA